MFPLRWPTRLGRAKVPRWVSTKNLCNRQSANNWPRKNWSCADSPHAATRFALNRCKNIVKRSTEGNCRTRRCNPINLAAYAARPSANTNHSFWLLYHCTGHTQESYALICGHHLRVPKWRSSCYLRWWTEQAREVWHVLLQHRQVALFGFQLRVLCWAQLISLADWVVKVWQFGALDSLLKPSALLLSKSEPPLVRVPRHGVQRSPCRCRHCHYHCRCHS